MLSTFWYIKSNFSTEIHSARLKLAFNLAVFFYFFRVWRFLHEIMHFGTENDIEQNLKYKNYSVSSCPITVLEENIWDI